MTALLLLALVGQCPPGVYCPTPTPTTAPTFYTTPAAPTWQWYQLQIDGRTVVVPAYLSGGTIYYDSTRVPPKPEPTPPTKDSAKTEPKPEPPSTTGDAASGGGDMTGDTLNYGLDMEAIHADVAGDRNVIQTNDPALGALLTSDESTRLFKPEVKVQVPDLTMPIFYLGVAIVVAILLTRRPRP